eukprot:14265309-Alexandrium_andersonii.AAC.1
MIIGGTRGYQPNGAARDCQRPLLATARIHCKVLSVAFGRYPALEGVLVRTRGARKNTPQSAAKRPRAHECA